MSECWYCYWGWSKPVAQIYQEALHKLDGDDSVLKFSSGHIVWSDENFEDIHVQGCLDDFDEYKGDYDNESLSVLRWSLEELLKIPEDVRCPCPEDYDFEHPELYPPKVEVVKT